MLNPARAATMLLPGELVLAAGVFGVQDRTVAGGLLGGYAVQGSVDSLVRAPAVPGPGREVGPGPGRNVGRAARVAEAAGWLAMPTMIAVSPAWIHICRWDESGAATAEVARFERTTTTVAVNRYRSACRLTLTDQRTGYRLAATGTVSRLNRYGSGVRAVLQSLSSGS